MSRATKLSGRQRQHRPALKLQVGTATTELLQAHHCKMLLLILSQYDTVPASSQWKSKGKQRNKSAKRSDATPSIYNPELPTRPIPLSPSLSACPSTPSYPPLSACHRPQRSRQPPGHSPGLGSGRRPACRSVPLGESGCANWFAISLVFLLPSFLLGAPLPPTYRPLRKLEVLLSAALGRESLVLLQAPAHGAGGDGEVAVVAVCPVDPGWEIALAGSVRLVLFSSGPQASLCLPKERKWSN